MNDTTTKPRIVKAPANGDAQFTLAFTKAEADALATICDVTLKASGLPAAQAVHLWMAKVQDAMKG